MTTPETPTPAGDIIAVEVTASWPADANKRALVSNMHVFQWDPAHDGVYVLLGYTAPPIWLTPEQGRQWVQDNPNQTIPVETLGVFFMTTNVAKEFCRTLAKHPGL